MQPERSAGRLMRMKNELRIAAGLLLAVTLAGCGATSPQPRPVTFDRPYLMLVTDRTTGEPLFMARVTDPTQP